ncbi:MAG: hypothetical protein LUH14_08210 [Clostridiaceae bacterium]|nr:hypothetical protein [Clostridiaceae bacterium]
MKELLLEFLVCGLTAAFLMIVHELSKALIYKGIWHRKGKQRTDKKSIFAVYRYIDPIGIIFSITSSVTFSRPYMFRIRDKKTNRILGFAGLFVLLLCFAGSVAAIRFHAFGVEGMATLQGRGLFPKIASLFLQYLAILSFGMFAANLFPVSTFDMGMIIAGFSSGKYLNIIRMDAVIKIVLIITVLIGLIQYGGYRLILFLL